MITYKQIYLDLLKERNCLERHIDTLSNVQKKRYSLVCKNIENIKNPVSSTLVDKVLFVKEQSISLDNLSHSSDYFFFDGTSVFLWYSSLVNYYVEEKMKEEEEFVFLDMYKCSLKEENFSSKLLYFQMVMRFVRKKSFCEFLGIKPYLYRDFYYNRLDKNVLETIMENLSHLNLLSFNTVQQREIKKFLSVLEEEKRLQQWQQKINEIIEYIRVHQVSVIPQNVYFSDGSYLMGKWFYSFLRKKNDPQNLSLKKIKKRGLYQVVKELYNSNTVPLHVGIPFDYGSSLRRVLTLYCLDSEQVFTAFKIPNLCMVQILENKLIPREDFILDVLRFLNNLPISDAYEKEFVEEAIQAYEKLKSMHLKGDKLFFVYYPKEEEAKYLELWKGFDSTVLAKVRIKNYDWYLKCLTYFYICKSKRRKPNTEDYFYDASSCYRWLTTQKRASAGRLKFKINEEQNAMLKVVLQEENLMNAKKDEKEQEVLANIDSFLDNIEKSIFNHDKILADLCFKEIQLVDAWRIICRPLMQREVPFTEQQIKRIKSLRWKMIEKKKSNLNHFDAINFGYELACFMDSLHFTIESLMEMFSFSRMTIVHYMLNINLPSLNHTQKMLSVLEKFDLTLCRDDQVEDIAHFKKVLLSLSEYLQVNLSFKKDVFSTNTVSYTCNLLKDIPISCLKEIHDEDIAWYEEFKKVYKIMWAGVEEDASFKLPSCRWFKREVYKMSLGQYSPAKKDVLHYLYFLYQKKVMPQKENYFIYKFISLSNFIYENGRIPKPKELLLFDNTDGNRFYYMIVSSIQNTSSNYLYLSSALQEQMKLLVQYMALCRRKRNRYPKDKIEGEKFFLGERIENIRICLGFSRNDFLTKMGWSEEEMQAFCSNRISLEEQHIESLLHLFEEMKGRSLRKDQLEEMQDFIRVLITKQLDDNFALKFTPKE